MASDVAIVTAAAATDVRDRLDVILRNSLWLFTHGYQIDSNREFVVDHPVTAASPFNS
jgi:hypothetical protein